MFDNVATEKESHELLTLAKKGLSKGGSDGGASILDLHSGALSKGAAFVDVYKTHPDLFAKDDFETYKCVLANAFKISPAQKNLK